MTTIVPESVRLIATALLPIDWAAQLGRALSPRLNDADAAALQERTVGLGHGIMLAHLRSNVVRTPTLGAWKASDPHVEGAWLWLVVLIPADNPAEHLGWMAHLAAGLHAAEVREALREASTIEAVLAGLTHLLEEGGPRQRQEAPREIRIANDGRVPYRLIVAILKEVEYVDHLLSLYVDAEIHGATVVEARGMAEYLSTHLSLFAGFKSAFKAAGHSQIILAVIPADRTAEVMRLVDEATGGIDSPGAGIVFALDVPAALGIGKHAR